MGYHVWLYNAICGLGEYVFRWFLCSIEIAFFGYHGYHRGTQKYSCQKVWYVGFQTPCRTCDLDIWVCLRVLLKFQPFYVFFKQKFTFSYVPWYWTKSWMFQAFSFDMMDLCIQDSGKCVRYGIWKLRVHTFPFKYLLSDHLSILKWFWSKSVPNGLIYTFLGYFLYNVWFRHD